MGILKNSKEVSILITVLIVIQLGWFLVLGGVQHGGDTNRYFAAADSLLNGSLDGFSLKQTMMLSYVFFVAGHRFFTDNDLFIILSQLAIFTAAGLLLWSVLKQYCSKNASYLLVIVFFGFFHLVRWNYYILTDSLAVSGSIFVTWLVHKTYSKENFMVWPYLPLLVIIAFIRPHLALIVFAFLMFVILRALYFNNQYIKGLVFVLFLFAMLISAFIIQYRAHFEDIFIYLLYVAELGRIVHTLSVDMPEAVIMNGPIYNYFYYIYDNFWSVLTVSIFRIVGYLTMVRPYYSIYNNLYLSFMGFFIYGLSLAGLTSKGYRQLKLGLLIIILPSIILISFTLNAWDSRYVMYIMPFLWLLMAIGFNLMVKIIKRKAKLQN